MKDLKEHIIEGLKIGAKSKVNTKIKVKTKEELKLEILKKIINNETDYNDIDVSELDDLSYVFEDKNITEIDISGWGVSNVTTLKCMFQNCKYLKTPGDLSKWNVSNVEDMSWMFSGCQNLINLGDLQNWEINGTKMRCAFQGCKKLKSLGYIKHWRPEESNYDIFSLSDIPHNNLPKGRP